MGKWIETFLWKDTHLRSDPHQVVGVPQPNSIRFANRLRALENMKSWHLCNNSLLCFACLYALMAPLILQIVREDRTLEPIVFPIPEICEYLTPETKSLVYTTAERDEQGSKVDDFFSRYAPSSNRWVKIIISAKPIGTYRDSGVLTTNEQLKSLLHLGFTGRITNVSLCQVCGLMKITSPPFPLSIECKLLTSNLIIQQFLSACLVYACLTNLTI